jgi:hypothetical protein
MARPLLGSWSFLRHGLAPTQTAGNRQRMAGAASENASARRESPNRGVLAERDWLPPKVYSREKASKAFSGIGPYFALSQRVMNNIIYIVGLVVVVIAVLSFFGLR